MRIAVIYFGLVRGGLTSHSSIEQNIIAPCAGTDVHFTFFSANNLTDEVYNPRNNEINIKVDNEEVFYLKSDYYILEKENIKKIEKQLLAAQKHLDIFYNNWISITNLLYQLASLRRGWLATQMLEQEPFDAYLFLRPDLLYITPCNIAELAKNLVSSNSILLPAWHSWEGLNDRFALAGPAAAKCYALRFDEIIGYCERHMLHSETFLAWALHQQMCHIGLFPMHAHRIRANGNLQIEDFSVKTLPLPNLPTSFSFDVQNAMNEITPK